MSVLNPWPLAPATGRALLVSALLVLLMTAPAGIAAADEDDAVGHVYVLNNNLGSPNSISVFDRAANGALTLRGTTSIGGTGSLAAFADGTQGSLIRSSDASRLFAVDAGSDQISVIDINDGHLSVSGVFPSGGPGPVSLTYGRGLLYVLNAANASAAAANVAGFHVDEDGRLHPIAGATRPLSSAHPNPAQVLLSPDGRHLLVTEKGLNPFTQQNTGMIDMYDVARDGSLSGPISVPSVGLYPFGMAFDPARRQEVLVDDGFSGAVTAYRLSDNHLNLVDGPVADHQIAPCWMIITRDGGLLTPQMLIARRSPGIASTPTARSICWTPMVRPAPHRLTHSRSKNRSAGIVASCMCSIRACCCRRAPGQPR